MSNLSTPSPDGPSQYFSGSTDVVPFLLFFFGPSQIAKIGKLLALRLCSAFPPTSPCPLPHCLSSWQGGNFAHDSTRFLPNGKKNILHLSFIGLAVPSLFRSCCWHQINIRLMPILLSFYYGHLFVRTHSRSEFLNSPTSAPCCAPLSFAPIPSMGDSHITLQQRQNESRSRSSRSSGSNGKYNCASKLVTELIN